MKVDILSVKNYSDCVRVGFFTDTHFEHVDFKKRKDVRILEKTLMLANEVVDDMYQFLDNLPEIENFLEEQTSLLDAENERWNKNDYYYRMCIDFILKMLGN